MQTLVIGGSWDGHYVNGNTPGIVALPARRPLPKHLGPGSEAIISQEPREHYVLEMFSTPATVFQFYCIEGLTLDGALQRLLDSYAESRKKSRGDPPQVT